MSENQMTAGKQLQAAREKNHMSLAELSEKTKIPVQCLKDIEEDYCADPRLSIYTRGHIKLYCQAVQIPVEPFLKICNIAINEHTDNSEPSDATTDDNSPFFRMEYLAVVIIWLCWLLYNHTAVKQATTMATASHAPAPIAFMKESNASTSPPPMKENHRE